MSEYPNQKTSFSETISEYLHHKNLEKKGKTPEVFLLLESLISDWIWEERRRNLGCSCQAKGVMLFEHPDMSSIATTGRGSSPANPGQYFQATHRYLKHSEEVKTALDMNH